MSSAKDIVALPGELRNTIHEYYIADADKTTVYFSRGKYIPPPTALASRRIRHEFLSLCNRHNPIHDDTKHIRLGVYDIDHRDATAFWSKAVVTRHTKDRLFDSVRITLVFTKDWSRPKAKHSCMEYFAWFVKYGGAVCGGDDETWEILDHRRFGRLRLLGLLLIFVGPTSLPRPRRA